MPWTFSAEMPTVDTSFTCENEASSRSRRA